MVQIVRPITTVSCAYSRSDGSGSSVAHLLVDEDVDTSDDNLTYISTTTIVSAVMKLSNVGVPGNLSDVKLRFRARNTSASYQALTWISLQEKKPMVPFIEPGNDNPTGFLVTNVWSTYELPLTAYAVGQLQDYSQLHVVIKSYANFPTNVSEEVRISAIELVFGDPVDINVTRVSVDALGKPTVVTARFSRVSLDAMGEAPAPSIAATRVSLDVLGKAIPGFYGTRLALDVAGEAPAPSLHATRLSVDVLGENIYTVSVNPNALPNPLPNFFINNWISSVILRSSWSTDVSKAYTVSEERRSLVDRPYRTLTIKFSGLRRQQATQLFMNILRFSQNRLVCPLFCDKTKTNSASSGSQINLDTRFARFFRGSRVCIHTFATGNIPANVEYHVITVINTGYLIVEGTLGMTYPVGSRVYPVIDTEVVLNHNGVLITDETFEIELAVNEVIGKSALFTTSEEAPVGTQTFNSRPIFYVSPDWSASLAASPFRQGEEISQGRSVNTPVRGTRSQFKYELNMIFRDRETGWYAIQFFDYVKGRMRPFYVVSPQTLFKATGVTSTSVTVQAVGNFLDAQTFITTIAIVMKNETLYLADVTSVTNGGATWTFNFLDIGVTPAIGNIRRVTSAHLVRLDQDQNVEEWITDQNVSFSWNLVDLLEEKDVVLGALTETYVFINAPSSISDLWYWCDASFNTYLWNTSNQHAAQATLQGQFVGAWDDGREDAFEASNPYAIADSQFEGPIIVYTAFNNGKRSVQGLGLDIINLIYTTQFFDNTLGLTLIYNVRMTLDSLNSNTQYQFFFQQGVLEWTASTIKMFNALDVTSVGYQITPPLLRTGELMTLVLRWTPNQPVRLYRDGTLLGSTSNNLASLPVNLSREIELCRLVGTQFDSDVLVGDDSYGEAQFFNAACIYKKALTNTELNSVGNYLANRYGGIWTNIP